uniref:SH3 domain-containing protein n=1 Tax=Lates calcarifer TaxID=8187 RepID=A0A4W6FCE4_LATCA
MGAVGTVTLSQRGLNLGHALVSRGNQPNLPHPSSPQNPKTFHTLQNRSSKVFWEEGGLAAAASDSGGTEALKTAESPPADLNPKPPPATEPAPSCAPKSAPVLTPQPFKTTEKPPVTPKPQCSTETPPSSNPAPPPSQPPGLLHPNSPLLSVTLPPQPNPHPDLLVAPRASMGAPPQDKSPTAGRTTPTLPPRPSAEVGGGAQTETQTGGAETQDTANQSVKAGSVRPGIPTKPAALTSPRRASAPSLAPKPTVTSPTPPDPNPVPTKPAAAPATTPKPSGPTAPVPAKPPTPAPTPATTPAPAPAAAPTSALAPAPAPTPAPAPAPALRKGPAIPTKPETTSTANPNSSDPPLPPRPSGVKFLPLRPPPMKSIPGRPPPPAVNSSTSSANQIPPPSKTSPAPSVSPASQSSPSQTAPPPSSVTANQLQAQRAPKRGPPLPPRPKPGHPLYSSYTSILPVQPEQKEQPDPPPVRSDTNTHHHKLHTKHQTPDLFLMHILSDTSGPRCTALFDYEGEEEDELTFSQGDVIALLEVIGQEWGRGQIHGRIGIFPLNFVEVVEPLPQPVSSPGETTKTTSADTTVIESTAAPKTSQDPNSEAEEWAVALFDFPGQTAEDLSFHKGALIRVTEHIDAEWRRGRLEGREGLYPAAFTLPHQAESVPVQQSAVKGVAKALFEFTAESEDELSLKV